MSTRSIIARTDFDGWTGVYCHSDGNPTWQGHQIWQLVRDFKGDLPAMMAFLCDGEHQSGWSWLPASRAEHDGQQPAWSILGETHRPCYFHWRGDTGSMVTRSTDGDTWAEWAYAINERTGKLFVYVAKHEGQNQTAWRLVRAGDEYGVDLLDDSEPDWAAIEQRGDAARAA